MEAEFVALITSGSAALGVIISWLSMIKKLRKDGERSSESKGVMASDIGYIKAGIDDLKRENRDNRREIHELSERVTRCEESVKQAHKRIDER